MYVALHGLGTRQRVLEAAFIIDVDAQTSYG